MSCGPTPSRSLLLLLLLFLSSFFSYTCFLFVFFSFSARTYHPSVAFSPSSSSTLPSSYTQTGFFFQPLYSIHSERRLDPLGARHSWTSHSLFSVSFIPFAFYFLVSLPVLARAYLASHHPKAPSGDFSLPLVVD